MRVTNIRIRPFNVGCNFQIVLPNGKTVLIDPWFTGNEFPGGHTKEEIEGADYIILTPRLKATANCACRTERTAFTRRTALM